MRDQHVLRGLALLLGALLFLGGAFGSCSSEAKGPKGPEAPATEAERWKARPVIEASVVKGRLGPGWFDFGWCPKELKPGTAAVLQMGEYGGWILAKPDKKPDPRIQGLRVRFRAAEEKPFLKVALSNDESAPFPEVFLQGPYVSRAGDEVVALIPLKDLNPVGLSWDRVVLAAARPIKKPKVELFELAFVGGAPLEAKTPERPKKPTTPVSLEVDCAAPGQPISDGIYGIAVNMLEDGKGDQFKLGATARRWGGNPTSRFNYKLGSVWNTGEDWFFRNVDVALRPGWTWREVILEDQRRGLKTAWTLPLLEWVAKDKTSHSFSVKRLGKQQATAPENGDAGNGLSPSGKPLTPPPPTTTSVKLTSADLSSWIKQIKTLDGKDGRAVHLYYLGNEPMLWNSTHRDVHPEPATYDEVWERSRDVATIIRKVDPDARIAGPTVWGWPAYFFSAKDAAAGFFVKPDRRAHDDVPFLAWFLQQARDHEKKTGVRVLDVLDVHFYPQGQSVYSPTSDDGTAQLRLRQTRGLWDKSYKDESWIGEPVYLLPRLQELIDENYPGLGISIGEWNFGGEDHVSGALATAEAFGRMAEHRVEWAFYWTWPRPSSLAAQAWKAFRNYDGQGATFGARLLPSTSQKGVSLFSSLDEKRGKVVAVAVNLDIDRPRSAAFTARGCRELAGARAFQLHETQPTLQAVEPRVEGGQARLELPPWSLTVIEVSK